MTGHVQHLSILASMVYLAAHGQAQMPVEFEDVSERIDFVHEGFLLLGDPVLALVCFIPAYAIANMYVGPLWSTVQTLARPNMRATASAVLLLILNVIGLGIGPPLVGLMNDALTPAAGDLAVRYSLVVVTLTGGLASIFFWIGSATLREDLASRDAPALETR